MDRLPESDGSTVNQNDCNERFDPNAVANRGSVDPLDPVAAPFGAFSPSERLLTARYDAVIALAILEHVYDPSAAIVNFRRALKPGGRLFLYVPWIWRYHAPKNLIFQDYQRLSRDGLAYALRDFDEVTLYPLRGKYSAIVNLLKWWKPVVERRFGGRINRLIDARASDWRNTIQASGFFAEAVKPKVAGNPPPG